MGIDFTPSIGKTSVNGNFRFWCQKVIPLVYDDSLSYYELLCKVVDYLNKTMDDVNTLSNDVSNLHSAYTQLQDWVNNYFDNLDVQEEINKKLDEMASNGVLSELLNALFDELKMSVNSTIEQLRFETDEKLSDVDTDINVLTQRMNTFTSLPSGSTSADGELQDIRIGYQGHEYSSAGEAVRQQVQGVLNTCLHYLGVFSGTILSSIDTIGYYSVSQLNVENVVDVPIKLSGVIYNFPNIRDGNAANILQIYVANNNNVWVRNLTKNVSVTDWVNLCGYQGSVSGDTLTNYKSYGYYNISAQAVETLTDYPGRSSGILIVYPRVRDGRESTIMQEILDTNGSWFIRYLINDVPTEWFNPKKPYNGTLNKTKLSELTEYGYYSIPATMVQTIEDYPSKNSGVVINIPNIRGGLNSYLAQIVIDSSSIIYTRNVIDGDGSAWVNSNVYDVNANNNVSVIGDSITYGYYANDNSGTLYTDTNRSFPVLLSKRGYNVNNLAIGGMGYLDPASTSQQETYLDVIYDNDFTDCDCFIISGGINDYKGNQPLGSVDDNDDTTVLGVLNTIINYFAENYPNCRLIVTSPFNSSRFGDYSTKYSINTKNNASVKYTLGEMSDKLKEICDRNCITYIDLLYTNCFNLKTLPTMFPDGVHPSFETMLKLSGFTIAKILSEFNGVTKN